MSVQKGLRLGDRVWVRVPRLPIERKFGTITAVKRNRYVVDWDIETEEDRREYSGQEIASLRFGQNGKGLRE